MSFSRKDKKEEIAKIAPSYAKNLDNLKLLFSDPDIEKMIENAREMLKIPQNGFFAVENSADEMEHWWAEMYRRSNETKNSEPSVNYLTKMVATIVKDWSLPLNYADSIQTYIVSGEIIAPPFPFSFTSTPDAQPEEDPAKILSVNFYTDVTDEDLRSLKWIGNFFKRQLPPSPEPIKDIEAKLLIEKMRKDKKVYNTVDEVWAKRTVKDIADFVGEEFETRVTVNQVHDNPREMNRIRKRFKKSGM